MSPLQLLDEEHESDRDGDAEEENGSQDSANKPASSHSHHPVGKKKKKRKKSKHQLFHAQVGQNLEQVREGNGALYLGFSRIVGSLGWRSGRGGCCH